MKESIKRFLIILIYLNHSLKSGAKFVNLNFNYKSSLFTNVTRIGLYIIHKQAARRLRLRNINRFRKLAAKIFSLLNLRPARNTISHIPVSPGGDLAP